MNNFPKFTFKNLGYIDEGEIQLNKLTIICGKNNTGKTYLTYAIYGALHFFHDEERAIRYNIKELEETLKTLYTKKKLVIDLNKLKNALPKILNVMANHYVSVIPMYFGAPREFFNKTAVTIHFGDINFNKIFQESFQKITFVGDNEIRLVKEKNSTDVHIVFQSTKTKAKPDSDIMRTIISENILNLFIRSMFPEPFPITSERTGIQLFKKELDIRRNAIFEEFLKSFKAESKSKQTQIMRFAKRHFVSAYPISIQENIEYVREYESVKNKTSFIYSRKEDYEKLIAFWDKYIVGGKFKYDKETNSFLYRLKKERKRREVLIPLHIASSASKSLLSMDIFIKHLAQKNSLLVIDEPELNLHPEGQRNMARFLAMLANAGISILMTTHSDYIVKEINNLIMLSNEFKEKQKVMKDFKYDEAQILSPKDVNIYVTEKHSVEPIKIQQDGFDLEVFDGIIIDQNEASNSIYYSLGE